MSIREQYLAMKGTLEERLRVHSHYKNVFETPSGEIVLRHIMKIGKVTTPTFVAGDPHMTSFNEGQRRLAMSILRFVRKDHDELIKQIERGLQDET